MGKGAQVVLSVALAVLAGGWIAMERLAMPPLLAGAAVAAAGLAAAVAYFRLHERRGPLGIVMLAALAGLPFTIGAMAVGRPAAGIVPSILAAWLQVLRVMVADLETESPDHAADRRTLTIVATGVALSFIPVSFILPARVGFGGAFFLIALFVELAVLVSAARLIVGRINGVNALLKGAMFVGAIALVAGRVT